MEKEADREPDRASRDGDKAAKGNPRRKPTEHSGTCTRAISLVVWEQKLEGCGWRKHNWSLFLIAREGARRGCGWRDRAEGSLLLQERCLSRGRAVTRTWSCFTSLLIHLLPHGLFLAPVIWLHHLPHTLLAQVALVFPLGHPFWPPSWS